MRRAVVVVNLEYLQHETSLAFDNPVYLLSKEPDIIGKKKFNTSILLFNLLPELN